MRPELLQAVEQALDPIARPIGCADASRGAWRTSCGSPASRGELAELLGAMARMHWPITVPACTSVCAVTRGDEAREQHRGAMALVIVRAPFDLPRTHWKQRLRAIER